jgi:glycosyltransferase involved in cell wall biosynthesis
MRIALNALAWQYERAGVEALHILETACLAANQPDVERVLLYQPSLWPQPSSEKVRVFRFRKPGAALRTTVLEQWSLPRKARAQGAQLLLTAFSRPSLFTRLPQAWLDSRFDGDPAAPDSGRLSRAFSRALVDSGAARLAYSDLPPESAPAASRLAPWIDSRFRPEQAVDDRERLAAHSLTPGYVLVHGLTPAGAARLLAAWTWVEAGVADSYPLVLIGAAPEALRAVRAGAAQAGLESEIATPTDLRFDDIPAIYRNAVLFLQLDRVRSGQSLRWAQASGLAVAGIDSAPAASVLGDAGYLAPVEDARGTGAACLTLLVEEELRRALSAKGLKRAGSYRSDAGELVSKLAAILSGPAR